MSRRRLSAEERALWKGVVRSIAPLRKAIAAESDEAAAPPVTPARVRARAIPSLPVMVPAPKPEALPRLAPLDRRAKQRIARGKRAIDGRLDLHGMTQAEAFGALSHFLHGRQARGAKVVLIITGKGGLDQGGGGRGVLHRMVPLWLAQPEFRGLIVGFEAASRSHGGEGALYVSLRRPR